MRSRAASPTRRLIDLSFEADRIETLPLCVTEANICFSPETSDIGDSKNRRRKEGGVYVVQSSFIAQI